MSLDDHHHASTNKMKTRRSIDLEFHDHLDNSLRDELEGLFDSDSDHERSSNNLGFDMEEASFGEASYSCEPDHEFLDQVLEECHPERLNLLEQSVPECVYNKQVRSRSPTLVPKRGLVRKEVCEHPESLLVDSATITLAKPNSAKDIEASNDAAFGSRSDLLAKKATENPGSNTEEEDEDAFTKSPHRKGPTLGLENPQMLGTMGNSTKKSLRRINGTFWSKPFKGLAQSITRSGSAQGIADS